MSFFLSSCEAIPPETLPASDTYLRQNLICPPASRLYLKELFNILQTVSFCSRYTTFFFLEFAFIDKTYLYPNALRSDLRTNHSLNADVSENTLPFVSQSINNLSDYDISQSHDWECPSLSSHVLLFITQCITFLHKKGGFLNVLSLSGLFDR